MNDPRIKVHLTSIQRIEKRAAPEAKDGCSESTRPGAG